MNIVITAGGTTENIDPVRAITNTGTGKLGARIADTLADSDRIDRIFYICSETAVLPGFEKTDVKIIRSVSDLEKAVKEILSENRIDWFIHSMAVSDYAAKYVTTPWLAATSLSCSTEASLLCMLREMPGKACLDNTKKLSSDEDMLLVALKKTPKIIKMVKELSPKTKLIGFKLLDNVPYEMLHNAAMKLMKENSCEYVVANDKSGINTAEHEAWLIKNDGEIAGHMYNKQQIADSLKKIMLESN